MNVYMYVDQRNSGPSGEDVPSCRGEEYGIEQTEVSAIPRMQRVRIARLVDDNDEKPMVGRVKGVDITVPIVYGSIAFWLGKKAVESTHKWTAYVRSATNENLGVLIKKVVF